MKWHFQVMYHDSGEGYYAIHEYFTMDSDSGPGWTQDPISMVGNDIEDLRMTLEHMLNDINRHGVKNYESGKSMGDD